MNQINNSKNAVIYVRVSSKEQVDEGNSLVTQQRVCKEYVNKNGYEVIKVFEERGESAKTDDRTELQNMLTFCNDKRNGVSLVVVYKVDRFARKSLDHESLRFLLKKLKIELRSATETFDDSPSGRFMERTLANVAEFDNDMRSERCSGGMKEAIREGRYVWAAPVGYINAQVGGKATIVQSKMAPLIRRAFELVATGLYPIEEVWRMVTKEGLVKKNGKIVGRSYFHYLLRNEVYAGWINKFGERHKGLFEPIVSEELFKQVQKILRNKGRKSAEYKTDHPDFPLRRFVVNALGGKLTGSYAKGKYPYYRFGGKGANYKREEFEKLFTAYMDSFGFEESKINKLKRFVKEDLEKATREERKDAEKLKSNLKEITERQDILIQKNIQGVISDEVLKKQLDHLERQSAEIESALAIMNVNQIDPNEALAFVEEYLMQPSSIWKKIDFSSKLKLQRFQFPSGVVFDGEKFGTTEISLVFKAKGVISPFHSTAVDPSGFEPLTSSLQMRRSTN
jgi:site-specific DNA recombinase